MLLRPLANYLDNLGYLRESGDKVFFRYREGYPRMDTSEFMLYDFGATVGDTLSLRFDFLATRPVVTKNLRFVVLQADSVLTIKGAKQRLRLYNLDRDTLFLPSNSTSMFGKCYRDT